MTDWQVLDQRDRIQFSNICRKSVNLKINRILWLSTYIIHISLFLLVFVKIHFMKWCIQFNKMELTSNIADVPDTLLPDLWNKVNRIKQFGPSSVSIHLNSILRAVDLYILLSPRLVFLSYEVNCDKLIVVFNPDE